MNGIINLYKECGVTSFHAAAAVRRILKVKKAGHTGTLDPLAEGVLPVCVGYATKFAGLLTAADKQYIARFKLGAAYDTFDVTGSLRQTSDIRPSKDALLTALNRFIGEPVLTVPAFSAKKIDGVRAYTLARKGELTDAGTAPMKIYNLELLSYNYPDGEFALDCAKGVYVRSVIHELGVRLGSYAAMSGLTRSRSGKFHMKDACRLDDIRRIAEEGRVSEIVTPVQTVLDLPKGVVKSAAVNRVLHGIPPVRGDFLTLPDAGDGLCLLLTEGGDLLALGTIQKDAAVPVRLSKVIPN